MDSNFLLIRPGEPTAANTRAARAWSLRRSTCARGWTVVVTVRGNTWTALHDLVDEAGDLMRIEQLEINDPGQIEALRGRRADRTFDVLFVNAGISSDPGEMIGEVTTEEFGRVMMTNTLGLMRVMEALEDLMPETGTIAVMSSGLGSVVNNTGGRREVYRASKAALNTLIRSFAARHAGDPRSPMLTASGWVRTDMGEPKADLDVATSVRGMVDTLAAQSGKPGLCYLD